MGVMNQPVSFLGGSFSKQWLDVWMIICMSEVEKFSSLGGSEEEVVTSVFYGLYGVFYAGYITLKGRGLMKLGALALLGLFFRWLHHDNSSREGLQLTNQVNSRDTLALKDR